jgi:hypothetical protein
MPAKSAIQVPNGLPASTGNKLAQLARLITIAQEQPDALKKTNQVLPGFLAAKQSTPMPIDTPFRAASVDYSLRG